MVLIDTASRYLYVAFLETCSEALSKLLNILSHMYHVQNKHLFHLRSDNAKQPTSLSFQKEITSRGIHFQPAVLYSLQEHSIAKLVNGILLNTARASLVHSRLLLNYWEDAITDAAFKHSSIYHSSVRNLPYTL